VETTFRHLVDDSDWDFREIDGIRRIWFTDILNPAKFRTIQEKIREKMWGNPGSSI